MTEKEQYFEELKELETAKLFLPETNSDEEIPDNCIWISMSSAIAKQTSSAELCSFLARLKANRQQQLLQSGLEIDLLYYIWFDEQATQLRFDFIRYRDTKLPFGCELEIVESEEEIVAAFLGSGLHDGIPWSVFEIVDNTEMKNSTVDEEDVFVLKVCKEVIYGTRATS